MSVVEGKLVDEVEAALYMQRWMADHPGPWSQCGYCGAWGLWTHSAASRCGLCPPQRAESDAPKAWWPRSRAQRG